MCGRFTNRLTWREIVALYRLAVPAMPERNLPARYNICPTDNIDVVIEHNGDRELAPMRWGLVPSWWKRPLRDFKVATFNARVETVEDKATFRFAFRRTRCLIPASGYYEWRAEAGGKQPYYFTASDGRPLTIAGLWDEWRNVETGEQLRSCTMMITKANEFVSDYHDRMPVLLAPGQHERWLAGNIGTKMLRPAPDEYLQVWPVSQRVNSSRAPNDDPTLTDRIWL
jgi:putative SOS response-associated peptidase YedK